MSKEFFINAIFNEEGEEIEKIISRLLVDILEKNR